MSEETKKAPAIRFQGFTDDWEQRKLGELASFSKGNGYTKGDLTAKGKPIILYGRLYTKYETIIENVDTFAEEKENSVISNGNEVIVPASGESSEDISRASVVAKSGIILGGDLNVVKPKTEIDSSFLALTISNGRQQKELSKKAQGKSIVHLHNSDLKEVNLVYPQKEEQTKIGNFFKNLDKTIALHQRKLTLLEQLKQTYLADMFPQSQESIPILRFTGHSEPWEQRKLGELVSKAIDNRGKTPPTQEKGIYPLLEVGSIGGYSPDYSKVNKYVDDDTYNTWFRAHLKENDILFSTVGNTGLATLMDNFEGATVAQNIVGFRAKESAVPEFLLQMFKLPSNLKKAKSIEMGAVQPSIKVSQLIHVEYHIPTSKEEQAKIGAFFKRLDDTIALLQEKIAHLKVLKNTLLNKMFI